MRRLLRPALVVGSLALFFLAGFFVADSRLPPYERLKAATDSLRGTAVVRQLGFAYHRVASRFRTVKPPGAWSPSRDRDDPDSPISLSAEQRELVSRLQSVGYLDGYETAGDRVDVTVWNREKAYPGFNLYISGHTPAAFLTDMSGRLLHQWAHDFRRALPDAEVSREGQSGTGYWRRVHLFPNGELLAIFSDYGLIRLDKDSQLLWATPGGFHHDLAVDANGRIYTLERKIEFLERIHPFKPVLVDFVVTLDADGKLLDRFSLLEAFERSSYASLLAKAPPHGNLMHTNTIEILDESAAFAPDLFAKGRALVSVREWDVIALVDVERREVVWALTGQWRAQHQPTLLDSGKLLLLDNMGHRGLSKVIEFDPLTQQIEWSYAGSEAEPFSTLIGGSCQRLRNGNTLITETDTGRAFEVTSDGEIVWEFMNNARVGPEGELVANLSELIRIESGYLEDWLSAEPSGRSAPAVASDAGPTR